MLIIDEPGLYDNLKAEDYHLDPVVEPSLSASIATVLLQRSPLHAKWKHPRLVKEPITEAAEYFDLGHAVHSLFLDGIDAMSICDATNKEGELVTDWKTKAAREFRDKAREEGKIPLLGRHVPQIRAMIDSMCDQLGRHKEASDAFSDDYRECTLIWQEKNGVWCRCRPDSLRKNLTVCDDLKTNGWNAEPGAIGRQFVANGLDIQEAFYLRGIRTLFPDVKNTQFRFICIETEPPHALSVIQLDPAAHALADAKVEYAIKKWGECLKSGNWPGYTDRVAFMQAPNWEEQNWIDRQMRDQ
jgi:hypothetical protein